MVLQSHRTPRVCPGQQLMPGPLPAPLPQTLGYLIYLQSPQSFIPSVTLCPRQQYQSHHYRETGHWAYHGSRQVAPQLSWLRICFDSYNIKDGAAQIVPLLPGTHPSSMGPRSYGWLSVTGMERGMEGAEVSAPHLQVLGPFSHLALQPPLLTHLMPRGG